MMARFDLDAASLAAMATSETDADAFHTLGLIYAVGRGVPVDLVVAHKWFNIAVARGHAAAVERRAELSYEMTRDQIAQAQRDARAWLQRA
jgi:uncharacterized protein